MISNYPIIPITEWGEYKTHPLNIAGPCSAESELQIMTTAKELSETKIIDIFRAGTWKPRTRPGSFEGVGEKGLRWLQNVQKDFGLKVTTEVANAKHVELALKHQIDFLWIGARTTANPFAVQEIADALKGCEQGVLIKNPVNSDIELWIGAIERIAEAGITKIAAVHRGFYYYEKSKYRNMPQWQIPIELKRRFSGLPIICDPSHITGNTHLIQEVSQQALDLNFDGLMIEVHCNPNKALSDSQQQLTPQEYSQIINNLIVRLPESQNRQFIDVLNELRSQIDVMDDQLLEILAQRMNIVRTIGKYKKENKITAVQISRWDEIVQQSIEKGMCKGLSEEFIIQLFKSIHQESINTQTQVMNSEHSKN